MMRMELEHKKRGDRSSNTLLDVCWQNLVMLQFHRQKVHPSRHLENPNLHMSVTTAVISQLAIKLYVDTAIRNINGVIVRRPQLIRLKLQCNHFLKDLIKNILLLKKN